MKVYKSGQGWVKEEDGGEINGPFESYTEAMAFQKNSAKPAAPTQIKEEPVVEETKDEVKKSK